MYVYIYEMWVTRGVAILRQTALLFVCLCGAHGIGHSSGPQGLEGWAQPGVREPYKCDTLSSSWYKHGSALQLTSCWDACTSHQAKQP